jgi:hypothetical protein
VNSAKEPNVGLERRDGALIERAANRLGCGPFRTRCWCLRGKNHHPSYPPNGPQSVPQGLLIEPP